MVPSTAAFIPGAPPAARCPRARRGGGGGPAARLPSLALGSFRRITPSWASAWAPAASRSRRCTTHPAGIMCKVVGIDLGTTNSAVAMVEGGVAQIVPSGEGGRTTPSVVAWPAAGGGGMLVGAAARRQGAANPENTFASVKRVVGRNMEEVEVDVGLARLSYRVIDLGDDGITLACPALDAEVKPQAVSAAVLSKLKADAEAFIGEEVTGAVISVPAHFTYRQRDATKEAAAEAGLGVLRIINEPNAAAIAYGFQKLDNEVILVYDLGGGTLDVTVLEVGDQVFEVLSTSGDSFLGGDDWDERIVQWAAGEVVAGHGWDPRTDPRALQVLKEEAEAAKISIAGGAAEATITVPRPAGAEGGGVSNAVSLTEQTFEELCAPLVERAKVPLMTALKDAHTSDDEPVTVDSVDEVILVGGGTLVPSVEAMVSDLMGGRKCNRSLNPMEVVALGAAIQAEAIGGTGGVQREDVILLDEAPDAEDLMLLAEKAERLFNQGGA